MTPVKFSKSFVLARVAKPFLQSLSEKTIFKQKILWTDENEQQVTESEN